MADQPDDVEMQDTADEQLVELAPKPQYRLDLLSTIRTCQSQNGVNHGDYGRYRQFCTSRLANLYKALKMQHGKGRYQKRKLEVSNITDVRHLHIPLFSAERAWALAMELKKENEQQVDLAKRRHAIKRLRKASIWAAELAQFATEVCDTRSALEAEAYASWLGGVVLLEKESDWESALTKFGRAKKLFQELAKVSAGEQQTLCLQMVDEIEPSLRYCNYQISRKGGAPVDPSQLLDLAGGAGDLLQSKLAALASEAQSHQAQSTSVLAWQGRSYSIHNERVRVCVHQAQEVGEQLGAAAQQQQGLDAQLGLFDKMLNLYNEAKGLVRGALKAGAIDDEAQLSALQALDTALAGTVAEHSVQRSRLMVADAASRFSAGLQRAAQGKKLKDKERYARPEELVRLYDVLLQHVDELSELGSGLGGRQGEGLMEGCGVATACCQAARCYYIGHVYLAGDKHLEAFALFSRALERISAAQARLAEAPQADDPQQQQGQELQQLQAAARAWRCAAHAELCCQGLAAAEGVQQELGGLSLQEQQQQQQVRKYMAEHLEEWESFAGGAGSVAHICRVPPAMRPVAFRPIMLDTAANCIAYPSLEHRLKKQPQKSTFARLFGW